MTALTLPRFSSRDSHAAVSLFKIWDLLSAPRTTPEEERLLDVIRNGTRRIGAPVLAVAELSELDPTLDEYILAPELATIIRESAQLVSFAAVEARLSTAEMWPKVEEAIGAGCAKRFEEIYPLVRAIVSMTFQLIDVNPGALEDERDFRDVIYDLTIPSPVRECLRAALRGDVATLGVAAAMEMNVRVAPWLAHALVERIVRGTYERTRLLASVPGILCPASLIPDAARLDFVDLTAKRDGVVATIDGWFAEAERSGAEVFFPQGDADAEAR
jgi:hypothetical protein